MSTSAKHSKTSTKSITKKNSNIDLNPPKKGHITYEKQLPLEDFSSENHKKLQQYICPLCNGVLVEPLMDQKGHMFCKNCLSLYEKNISSKHKKLECPVSNHVIKMANLKPNELIINYFKDMAKGLFGMENSEKPIDGEENLKQEQVNRYSKSLPEIEKKLEAPHFSEFNDLTDTQVRIMLFKQIGVSEAIINNPRGLDFLNKKLNIYIVEKKKKAPKISADIKRNYAGIKNLAQLKIKPSENGNRVDFWEENKSTVSSDGETTISTVKEYIRLAENCIIIGELTKLTLVSEKLEPSTKDVVQEAIYNSSGQLIKKVITQKGYQNGSKIDTKEEFEPGDLD